MVWVVAKMPQLAPLRLCAPLWADRHTSTLPPAQADANRPRLQ
jgi:hypothetical protein